MQNTSAEQLLDTLEITEPTATDIIDAIEQNPPADLEIDDQNPPDFVNPIDPEDAGEGSEKGRAHIRRKLREFRGIGQEIAGKLKQSDMAEHMRADIGALLSCGRYGKVWQADGLSEERCYHVRWISCKHRLCPVCEYKKALHRRKVIEKLHEEWTTTRQKERWHLITLTIPNPAWDTEGELRLADEKLKKDAKAARRKWDISGYICGIETTMNHEAQSYHHHMHILASFTGTPPKNLYRCIKYQGDWREPEFHDIARGMWRVIVRERYPLPNRKVWIKDADAEIEGDNTYREYVRFGGHSIQRDWLEASGYLIAHIQEAKNPKEAAKYVGKWSEIRQLPADIVAAFLVETRGLRRWIIGGDFRKAAADWDKAADEEEPTSEGWVEAWRVDEGLVSTDPEQKAITQAAIRGCLWSLYEPDELERLYKRRKWNIPTSAWYAMGRAAKKKKREAGEDDEAEL